jgi:uncharacterized pyridoxal phosphate-containing UPF0001 family protein
LNSTGILSPRLRIKTAVPAERFAWVHAVDRLRIVARPAAQRPPFAPPLNVCLQVRLGASAATGLEFPRRSCRAAAAGGTSSAACAA